MEIKWEIENGEVKAPGMMVMVNNHKMHIYKTGKGPDTLVFMAGGGTCCPVLDFKPLWMRLANQFSVVIVEKAGYGWSEVTQVSRDVNMVLSETRTALKLAKLQPPYVLLPHSLSGIEALAWARLYPNEVKAIVGLDAAIPVFYNELTRTKVAILTCLYRMLSITTRLGILRIVAKTAEKSIRACGQFSEKEVSIYKHMFIHNSFTRNMLEEVKLCRENAKKVDALGYPTTIPFLSFISDGKEIGVSNWREIQIDFIAKLPNGKYTILDCGHYIHYYESQRIALEIEKFIFSLS